MIQWTLTIGSLVPLPFSKTSLNNWNFTVHILLNPDLENFEHYFTSVWDECNHGVVWAFFGTACLWDWNKNQFPWDPLNLSFGLSWKNQGTYSSKLKGGRGGGDWVSCFLDNSRERLQGLTKPSVKSLTGKNRVGKGTQAMCIPRNILSKKNYPELEW